LTLIYHEYLTLQENSCIEIESNIHVIFTFTSYCHNKVIRRNSYM